VTPKAGIGREGRNDPARERGELAIGPEGDELTAKALDGDPETEDEAAERLSKDLGSFPGRPFRPGSCIEKLDSNRLRKRDSKRHNLLRHCGSNQELFESRNVRPDRTGR
jgi:hypothetical protein